MAERCKCGHGPSRHHALRPTLCTAADCGCAEWVGRGGSSSTPPESAPTHRAFYDDLDRQLQNGLWPECAQPAERTNWSETTRR